MTVHQLKESLELTVLVEQTTDKKITGCYIGDLLSWAMSRVLACGKKSFARTHSFLHEMDR